MRQPLLPPMFGTVPGQSQCCWCSPSGIICAARDRQSGSTRSENRRAETLAYALEPHAALWLPHEHEDRK